MRIVSPRRRHVQAALAAVLFPALLACGDSAPAPARPWAKGGPAPAPGAPAPAAAAAPAPGGPNAAGVTVYAKVDDKYRHTFTKADYMADPSGDVNRDPFRMYLVTTQVTTESGPKGPNPAVEDECPKKIVAAESTIGDLRLVGIVARGTESFALFVDGRGKGHKVRVRDCMSKDRVKIKSMSEGRVIGEQRGVAPPGGVAPPALEKEWPLHPEEMKLEQQVAE